jgi:hypothetical protein
MLKRNLALIIGFVCLLLIVAGFVSLNWDLTTTDDGAASDNTDNNTTGDNDTIANDNSDNTDLINDDDTSNTPSETDSASSVTSEFSSTTVTEALVDNKEDDYNEEDYIWDSSDEISVTLNEDSIAVNNNGATVDGTTLTITSAGTYRISGTLDDGQIIVDTADPAAVRLILSGVTISSSTNAPICVSNADKAIIILADNTENYLTDAKGNEDNGTLCSTDDLTICGEGSLTVRCNSNDAIKSNDGLIIESGTITVSSVDDGIRGKDFLVIKGGEISVTSVGDGLKSDNDDDTTKGYISIEAGTITVTSSQGDAITAQTDLTITNGNFVLVSGGGSNSNPNDALSTKGLKAGLTMSTYGGQFKIDSSDDTLHSNNEILIDGGTFNLASGDDGVHADILLEINNGDFVISESYEGLESTTITINDGTIQIEASDDGINVAGGNTGNEDFMDGRPPRGGGGFEQAGNYYIYINGGVIYIDSGGDGLDSDGYIEMTDGLVIINGPTSNTNGAIDYGGGSFQLSGGTIIAVGAAGMAQAPTSTNQNVVNLMFSSTMSGNVLLNIENESGEDLLTFNPTKTYQSLVFTSPNLEDGTYTVYIGGSSTGTSTYGLYEGGTYSGGTEYGTFTIS